MLHPSAGVGPAEGLPLTHRTYMAACPEQASRNPNDPHPWVQVRRWHHSGPLTLCGRVTALHDRGEAECFAVQTEIGEVYVTGKNVRFCSGDGRCTCEALPPVRATTSTGGRTEENQGKPRGSTE